MKGTVKFFNDKRGWGFITATDGNDYFVHWSNIKMRGRKKLTAGDKVGFMPARGDMGKCLEAIKVEVLKHEGNG